MEHKAFAFDWTAFESNLRRTLEDALQSVDANVVASHIDANIANLTDPYEGNPLGPDWRSQIENPIDLQQLGDFALTQFYDPKIDAGLGTAWLDLSGSLNAQCQDSMLGECIGPANNRFDPGRMGSYFQSPNRVVESFRHLGCVNDSRLEDYVALLDSCRTQSCGVYVTF